MTPEAPDAAELLPELYRRPEWHQRAACRGMGLALFFPGQGDPTEEAKAICEGCPVRSQCLDAALAVPTTTGIWGGTTGLGRRIMRRGAA